MHIKPSTGTPVEKPASRVSAPATKSPPTPAAPAPPSPSGAPPVEGGKGSRVNTYA